MKPIKKSKTVKPKSGVSLPKVNKVTGFKISKHCYISQKFYRIDPKTKKPYKAGLFYATLLHPGTSLCQIGIGFSLCNRHAGDRYNFIKGKHDKKLDITTAVRRAYRWSKYAHAHIGSVKGFPYNNINFVLIPTFAVIPLLNFLLRCELYFWKNGSKYEFPMWEVQLKDGTFNCISNKNGNYVNLNKIINWYKHNKFGSPDFNLKRHV